MADFNGKVAIITGGTGGLGQHVTRIFLEQGATVVVPYREEKTFAALQEVLGELKQALHGLQADLLEEASVAQMVEEAVRRFGRIDVLVHLVGGFLGGVPVAETTLAQWEQMLRLNVLSTFLCCRQVVPVMIRQGYGKVVAVGAQAGLQGRAKVAAYAAAKAAVQNFTQSLAAEVKRHHINVNAVVPSTIDTPANRAAMPDADFSQWVRPQSIAEVILFLASDAARDVHGAIVPVFG
ncbi:MAG: SDR family NAD(P)-dependent oxidoreductase [bacterium]|jgi:NAD(P)-dependent dehydrogenase (short-subunit alcohol dehydrogenase family)|nr:SDR family oxidoreductase [candidate division KSB1 bacterium]MDH7559795.1 SDR family NAD(P)-dependent oxidoreductase [bacterium]